MSNNNREIDCAFDKCFVCVLENIMQARYKKIRVIILKIHLPFHQGGLFSLDLYC
jgi:hypothetical protein